MMTQRHPDVMVSMTASPSDESRCVVYVMSQQRYVDGNATLMAAAALAQRRRLPLAVVFCLERHASTDYDQLLAELADVEHELAIHEIPLIILIGPVQTTLAGFVHHTRPFIVRDKPAGLGGALLSQTVPWPGNVQSLDEVRPLIMKYLRGDDTIC